MFLNCHTWFSLKWGTLSPEALWLAARQYGIKKIALTDINNTSAWIEMLRICNERRNDWDLQLALGIEFRRGSQLLYIGLAHNPAGFQELCGFLSHHNLRKKTLPTKAPTWLNCFTIYPWNPQKKTDTLTETEFLGVKPFEATQVASSAWANYQHKLVILQAVTFLDKTGFATHRLLRAIGENAVLSKISPGQYSRADEVLMKPDELLKHFWQYPKLISNTQRVLESCTFDFKLGEYRNKKLFYAHKAEDHDKLRELALEGFTTRYSQYDPYTMQRLLKELDVIHALNFEAYFHTTLDIVNYARRHNMPYVGRGSGANSLVAYCLGITDVDPIALDLYFERFLNPHRTSPPDFDLDFSWKHRDEITQHIFDKYSTRHTALLATYSTFQSKAALRELAKVFGLPKTEIDELIYKVQRMPGAEAARQPGLAGQIYRYAQRLQDTPQHLSIHAGGVIISQEPLSTYTATDLPPKGFPITHFDMYSAEDLGLHKLDILSQRGLGHIQDAITLVKERTGKELDFTRFSDYSGDSKIKDLLREGRAMGCFYVESPAMRMLLRKLQCQDYLTLVAASSVIRPGVAQSGMMRQYIHRHRNPHEVQYLHPKMGDLMRETYGVMVYQEDVLKVAHGFANMDLGDADILRRGMSGKYRSRQEMDRVKKSFMDGCKEAGYPDGTTQEVWRQIASFSGYSFSKAHSASFAVESYQSLYLKAHYPLEFITGVINNFGGFYATEFYLHEARMAGANIEPPCVNQSEQLTTLCDTTLWLGFIHVKSLEKKWQQYIPAERNAKGGYNSLEDFLYRVPMSAEQAQLLVRIGALRFTGHSKPELLWRVQIMANSPKQPAGQSLFQPTSKPFALPSFEPRQYQAAYDQLELLGFPLGDPFSLLPLKWRTAGKTAKEAELLTGQQIEMVGYLVTTKTTATKQGERMHFGTFLDREGQFFDTVHFPPVAKAFPFKGKGFYHLTGKVEVEYNCPQLTITHQQRLSYTHEDNNPLALRAKHTLDIVL